MHGTRLTIIAVSRLRTEVHQILGDCRESSHFPNLFFYTSLYSGNINIRAYTVINYPNKFWPTFRGQESLIFYIYFQIQARL